MEHINPPPIEVYDNDVTLLYKAIVPYQVPTRLIIARLRDIDSEYDAILMGTNTIVFESLAMIIRRLSEQGETPSEIYDIITAFSSRITYDDIAMTYYGYFIKNSPNQPQGYLLLNQFYKDMGDSSIDRFQVSEDLDHYHGAWNDNILREYNQDLQRLQTITQIQTILATVATEEPIPFSPVTMTSSTKAFRPTIKGRPGPVTPKDGLDIFNQAIVSNYVPFLRYNDEYGKAFYRVYNGDKIENTPNYNITIIPSNLSNEKNTIYLTLWLGDPNNDGSANIRGAPRDAFFTMVYHLENNYLSIETPIEIDPKKGLIQNEEIAYQRAQNSLRILDFGVGREIKVRGEFSIWNFDFDESIFLDMILLESVMNVYLYVEENMKPHALKKRLDIHYRSIYTDISEGTTGTVDPYISNSASVSITMIPERSQSTEIVNIMNFKTGQVEQREFPPDTPYVHVNMTRGASRETVNEFIGVYQLLMRFYLDNLRDTTTYDGVVNFYRSYLPELNRLGPLLEQRRRKTGTEPGIVQVNPRAEAGESKLKQLQKLAPDLFVDRYPRKCVQKLQPTIITPEEVPFWRAKRLPSGDERQIMPFPKDTKQWLFVCDSDENPYIGVRRNKVLSNRDIYPYFPCCTHTDQMTPGVKSPYRDYIENRIPPIPVGAKADKPITTNKILASDRIGELPRSVNNILKKYSPYSVKMSRYGVNHNTNSFLHCICNAVDDPFYGRQPNSIAKDHYVSALRQYISQNTMPGLLKQELYDYTDDEIIDLLQDDTKFYDPALIYRAVEEIFAINIYVFTPGDNITMGALEVPRFKIFHSRPPRLHRPTVVIFKTWGSESNGLLYPQCELIVDLDEGNSNKDNKRIMKLFGEEMTEVCHKALTSTLKTITWSAQPDNTLVANSNIYYYIDHYSMFKVGTETIPISQFIDENGKLRSLTLKVGIDQEVTIITLPSQPENLPVTKETRCINPEMALRIFGPPTAVTRDRQDQIDGLWFSILDIPYGEYVPLIPQVIPYLNILPNGPPNPLLVPNNDVIPRIAFSLALQNNAPPTAITRNCQAQIDGLWFPIGGNPYGKYVSILPEKIPQLNNLPIGPPNPAGNLNITGRLHKLRRTLNIITQLVRWLYELARATEPITVDSFVAKYVAQDNAEGDSANYYNLDLIPRTLPITQTVGEAIATLTPLAPTLFEDERIVLYNQTFARRMVDMLRDYSNLRFGMPPDIIEYILGYYQLESDFKPIPFAKIFITEKELNAWLASLKSSQNYNQYYNIHDKIEVTMAFGSDPYLYKDTDGKIYIIQNVVGGNKQKALAIATQWARTKINIGFDPQPLTEFVEHMIYGISQSANLIPIYDNTNQEPLFVKLIYYGTQTELYTDIRALEEKNTIHKLGRYAAMLELL